MILEKTDDWTSWEPNQNLDSCCDWAEGLILTSTVTNAGIWNIVRGIPADWFGQWQDRVLWLGMKTVITANDGTFEPQLMQQWLKEHEPDYADDLFATLAEYSQHIRRSNNLMKAVSVLRRAGERRMVKRWAEAIIELCNAAAPIKEIRDLAKQAPCMEGGAV